MHNENERYRKVMGDWRGGPQEAPKKPAPRAKSALETPPPGANPSLDQMETPPPARGRYAQGAILCLNEEDLAVYFQPSPDGSGDLVFTLLADGAATLDAVPLDRFHVVELGKLNPEGLASLEESKTWTRKRIASGCRKPEFAALIPEPEPPASRADQPTPSGGKGPYLPPEPCGENDEDDGDIVTYDLIDDDTPLPTAAPKNSRRYKLRRGQCITVRFGGRSWDAVYWGRDHIGAVVAHKTNKSWELMHLDFERYKDTMLVDPEISEELVAEINQFIATHPPQP